MGAEVSSETPRELVELAEHESEATHSFELDNDRNDYDEVQLQHGIQAEDFSESPSRGPDGSTTPSGSFYCYICMSTERPSRGHVLPCGHVFCRSCLDSFFMAKILEADVNIRCFHPSSSSTDPATSDIETREERSPPSDELAEDSEYSQEDIPQQRICGVEVPEDTIQSVVRDPAIFDKFKRFQFMKAHPNARECPKCGHFNTTGSESNLQLKCEKTRCGFEFCFLHSDAHPNETCEQYETRTAIANKATLDFIAETTKKCPGCGMSIRKEGGCNHMKCPHCAQAFCWLCLTKIDDSVFPAHFQWWNATGTCSNLQMDEAVEPTAATRHLASLLMVVQIIVLGPLVLVSTLASILLCGLFVHPSRFREVNLAVFLYFFTLFYSFSPITCPPGASYGWSSWYFFPSFQSP